MKDKNLRILLGSASKGRQAVLRTAGYNFKVITADIDEKMIRDDDPKELALRLARAKADAILQKLDNKEAGIIITADQVVVCGGVILEKPENEDEARKFIQCYVDHPMETVSAVVVTNTQTNKSAEGVDIARVYFKPIPETVIDDAIKNGRIMSCAGAMRCEDKPFSDFIEKFEGTKDSTSGMPLDLLERLMKKI